MRVRSEARGGLLFAVAGLVAGGGHYLFQVLASRGLDASTFADFSGWLAHLSVAFVTGGVVQYLANFHPVPRERLRPWLVGVNAGVVGAALVATSVDTLGLTSLGAVVVLAAALGWVAGQAQIRLDFTGLAMAQIAGALAKLAVPLMRSSDGGRGFALGVILGFVPAVWVLTARLARAADPPGRTRDGAWAAPVILAVAANVFPQFDLLVARHAFDASTFATFARASLFYKAIYFAVFIFAQWLLPRQIRGGARIGPTLAVVAGFAGAACVGLTAAAPLLATFAFAWDQSPPTLLILASCAHVSLLTLIFLIIQDECAHARPVGPILILGLLGAEAVVAIVGAIPLWTYLGAALILQTAALALALRVTSTRPA